MAELRVAVIGPGRAGGALAVGLQRAGHRVVAVAGRSAGAAQVLAARLGAACVGASEAARLAELVLLTTPDGAIEPVCRIVAEEGGWRAGQGVVHCSGAVGRAALAAAAACGADTGGFHPLQTLTAADEGAARLPGSFVAVEADEPLRGRLHAVARDLGCTPFDLDGRDRALYHAAAAIVANSTVALYAVAAQLFGAIGAPEEVRNSALLPLLRGAVDSLARDTPARALTGPIARGDAGTVARHIGALAERAPELLPLYRELGRAALRLAGQAGLAPEAQAAVAAALDSATPPP